EGAAKALLSKVYLTMRDWDNAVKSAEVVIDGPYGYDLFEDYTHVFLPAYENGKEHIFSVQFLANSGGMAHSNMRRAIPSGIPGLVGGYGEQVPFYKQGEDEYFNVYKLYSAEDKRRDVTFRRTFKS